MDDRLAQVLARNEVFFRDVNERINQAAESHGSELHTYQFLCECSDPACTERVDLTLAEYAAVRDDPAHFVIAPGHELAAIEEIVERDHDHVVVEKTGAAGQLAAELDPRGE